MNHRAHVMAGNWRTSGLQPVPLDRPSSNITKNLQRASRLLRAGGDPSYGRSDRRARLMRLWQKARGGRLAAEIAAKVARIYAREFAQFEREEEIARGSKSMSTNKRHE